MAHANVRSYFILFPHHRFAISFPIWGTSAAAQPMDVSKVSWIRLLPWRVHLPGICCFSANNTWASWVCVRGSCRFSLRLSETRPRMDIRQSVNGTRLLFRCWPMFLSLSWVVESWNVSEITGFWVLSIRLDQHVAMEALDQQPRKIGLTLFGYASIFFWADSDPQPLAYSSHISSEWTSYCNSGHC